MLHRAVLHALHSCWTELFFGALALQSRRAALGLRQGNGAGLDQVGAFSDCVSWEKVVMSWGGVGGALWKAALGV